MKVMFSCVGTSDPARGKYDGPMLHILRYYRPDAVMIFLTKEMSDLDGKDHRIQKIRELIDTHWGNYQPEIITYTTDIRNPAEFDAMEAPLRDAMNEFIGHYPEEEREILVNLSSGTPQMKTVLADMTLDFKNCEGIQVFNPSDKSGDSLRTNDLHYDVDQALMDAEKNETADGARNRCKKPWLSSFQLRRIEKLLERKEYRAVAAALRAQSAPFLKAIQMADYLACRYNLDRSGTNAAEEKLSVNFRLNPRKARVTVTKDYEDVIEYFLMMKNFQQTERYTDFVLRLTPLTVRLQERLLDRLLNGKFHVKLKALKVTRNKREFLSEGRMQHYVPKILNALNAKLNTPYYDKEPSVYIYNLMLKAISPLTQEEKQVRSLFWKIGKLTDNRNAAAHSLTAALTDKDIQDPRNGAGCSCAELVAQLEEAITVLYPECDPAIFTIYRRCEEYIKNQIGSPS